MGNPTALSVFRQRRANTKLSQEDFENSEPIEQQRCRVEAVLGTLKTKMMEWGKESASGCGDNEIDAKPLRTELQPASQVAASKLLAELVDCSTAPIQDPDLVIDISKVKELAVVLGVSFGDITPFETLDMLKEQKTAVLEKIKEIEATGKARQKAMRPKMKLVLGAGKAKGLSTTEKKIVSAVKGVIEAAAVEYASGENKLNVSFDKMKTELKSLAAKMKSDLPEEQDLLDTNRDLLDKLVQVIDRQNVTFQADADLREDFDEDLLQRIGVAGVEVLNLIEGYINPPPAFLETAEYVAQKTQARLQRRDKKVEAFKIQQSKNAEKEAKLKEKEEKLTEKLKLKERAREDAKAARDLQKGLSARNVDESILPNLQPLGYVSYSTVPFENVETYERALHVWTSLASLPKTFKLSTFSFPQFVTMLRDEKQEFQMPEDICKGLAEVNSEGEKLFKTRGRNWFLILMDFVQTTLGTKKKKQVKRVNSSSSEDDSEDYSTDDSDDDSDDVSDDSSTEDSTEEESSNTDSSSSSSASTGTEDPHEKSCVDLPCEQEIQLVGMARDVKMMIDEFKTYGNMASWLNAELDQRLLLLEFLMLRALEEEEVIESATVLGGESDVIIHEKHLKDIKDEAEREIRKLKTTVADEAERNEKKEAIRKKADKEVSKVERNFRSSFDDGSTEKRIRPIGLDRYNRIYWRFPKEQVIHVQSVAGFTAPFPLVDPPKEIVDDDDDDEDESILLGKKRDHVKSQADDELSSRRQRNDHGAAVDTSNNADLDQTTWGTIPLSTLPVFIRALDVRGRREGPLRSSLEGWLPYLQSIPPPEDGKPPEGRMVSRSKRQNYGYQNTERMTMLSY